MATRPAAEGPRADGTSGGGRVAPRAVTSPGPRRRWRVGSWGVGSRGASGCRRLPQIAPSGPRRNVPASGWRRVWIPGDGEVGLGGGEVGAVGTPGGSGGRRRGHISVDGDEIRPRRKSAQGFCSRVPPPYYFGPLLTKPTASGGGGGGGNIILRAPGAYAHVVGRRRRRRRGRRRGGGGEVQIPWGDGGEVGLSRPCPSRAGLPGEVAMRPARPFASPRQNRPASPAFCTPNRCAHETGPNHFGGYVRERGKHKTDLRGKT